MNNAQADSQLGPLFKLGIPAIIAQLSQMALSVVDTLMAGKISPEALASIAVGTNLLNPIMVMILGVFLALNPIVAHLNGRNELTEIGSMFQHALLLAIILALPAIYLINNTEVLMETIGIQPALHQTVDEYLQACSFGIIPLFGFLALRFCNEGLFSNRAIMIVSLIAIPFNIVFNNWFIWGGLGVPAMGTVGIGYATALVWTIMFISIALYTLATPRYKHLAISDRLHPFDFEKIKEIIRIGLPMGIGVGMEIAMFAIVGLMIGRLAVSVVAAHQIAINIASMAYMIPLGLSIAISARVGFYSGRNEPYNKQRAARTGIVVAIIIASISSVLMFWLAESITKLYTDDLEVIGIATGLLFFAALFQLSDAIQVSLSGALRGIKDTKIPMLISAISYWGVGFPVGYYISEHLAMGATGYWIGLLSGLSCAAFLLAVRYYMLLEKRLNKRMSD